MKKFILLIAMLLPMSAMASIPELTALIDKYSKDVFVMRLTDEPLRKNMEMSGAGGFNDVLESVDILDTTNKEFIPNIATAMETLFQSISLETYADVEEDGEKIKVLYRKSGETVSDVVIYVRDDRSLSMMYVTCAIPENLLPKFISKMIEV